MEKSREGMAFIEIASCKDGDSPPKRLFYNYSFSLRQMALGISTFSDQTMTKENLDSLIDMKRRTRVAQFMADTSNQVMSPFCMYIYSSYRKTTCTYNNALKNKANTH